MSDSCIRPLNFAATGPIRAAIAILYAFSPSASIVSHPGMHSLRKAGSLSAAHTAGTGAGTLRLLCISMAWLSVHPRLRALIRARLHAPARLRSFQRFGQRRQAVEVVNRQEVVDVRQHRLDPGRARLEALVTQQRIEPHQPAAGLVQAFSLLAEILAGIGFEPAGDGP